MSLSRSNSAGKSRRNSLGGKEIWALRDTILQLQQELQISKLETVKVTNDLNNLISLIKRSWTGDNSASINIAKIVGVAPPDYKEIEKNGVILLKVSPKNRAARNWARLVIGLLKKEQKIIEAELERENLIYLKQREAFLAEQLERSNQSQSMVGRRTTNSYADLTKVDDSSCCQTKETGTSGTPARPLFRPVSATRAQLQQPYHQLAPDPIFDLSGNLIMQPFLFQEDSNKKQINGRRIAPQSATYPKVERPLKYETTRPVTAVDKTHHSRANKSAKRSKKFVPPADPGRIEVDYLGDGRGIVLPVRPINPDEEDDEDTSRGKPRETVEMVQLRMRLQKPDSVKSFEKDLNSMEMMESDFRKKALELQKRLGISSDGIV